MQIPGAHQRYGSALATCFTAFTLSSPITSAANAAQISTKDAQIIVKAPDFLSPSPAGEVVAVAYNPADPASTKAGNSIVTLLTGGTSPKVDIETSHAAAAATGASFQSAFRMMIHEI